MKHILVTNDDGFESFGFLSLLSQLKSHYEVTAIAPSHERSWIGKAISGHNAVGYKKVSHYNHDIYAIDGTPADCVQIGLYGLLARKPDLVVSGINTGANTGHGRILSSGTIGAAMEGAIDGVKSIAISLCDTSNKGLDYKSESSAYIFDTSVKVALRIINNIENLELPKGIDVISINIPFDAKEDADVEITVPHKQPYGRIFTQDGDVFKPAGITETYQQLDEGTDLKAIYECKVAITPIDLSLATDSAVQYLKENLKP